MRRNLRTGLALLAAYAVALQAILLAAMGPLTNAAGSAGQPICQGVHAPDQPQAPQDHARKCLAACLSAGCGIDATAPVRPVVAADYPSASMSSAAAFPVDIRWAPRSAVVGHFSRAPPRG
jgi:hypothetical protein